MHWRKRRMRRPAANEPGHAHEWTFSCYRRFPFLRAEMIDYIHANPVRRQLGKNPENWKWSSAGWIDGKNSLRPDAVDFGGLAALFGGEG